MSLSLFIRCRAKTQTEQSALEHISALQRNWRVLGLFNPLCTYLQGTMRLLRFQSHECSVLHGYGKPYWWRVLAGQVQGQSVFDVIHDFQPLLLA